MAVVFGPIGIEICRLPLLGGVSVGPVRMLWFVAFFALFGLVMGVMVAALWRAENPLPVLRRKPRADDYWIGDWNALLDGDARAPRNLDRGGPQPDDVP